MVLSCLSFVWMLHLLCLRPKWGGRVTNFLIPGRGLVQNEHSWRRAHNPSFLWSLPKVAYPPPPSFFQCFPITFLLLPLFLVSHIIGWMCDRTTFNMIFYWMIKRTYFMESWYLVPEAPVYCYLFTTPVCYIELNRGSHCLCFSKTIHSLKLHFCWLDSIRLIPPCEAQGTLTDTV